MNGIALGWTVFAAIGPCLFVHAMAAGARGDAAERLTVKSNIPSDGCPPIHLAYYRFPTGVEMIGPDGLSKDNGRTWEAFQPTPDFLKDLPKGYRRDLIATACDPKSGRLFFVLNALDTPGLDPRAVEPAIALTHYYLRYRVSTDHGQSYLFDEPIVEAGRTEANPFDGVWVGKNGTFLGDIGCIPIFTRNGDLLVPTMNLPLGPDGRLAFRGGGGVVTYSDVLVLVGRWGEDNRLRWTASRRVEADPKLTTTGVYEPTLAEVSDGRILMIMRGANGGHKDPNFQLPARRWKSVSDDGGRTWSVPEPWTYDTGLPFYSPSSMSQLLTHSSGRIFWIGNVNPDNSREDNWRWPLIIGEVDLKSLGLIQSSLVMVDTRRPDDPPLVHISHFRAFEDRETGEIVLTVPRALNGYKSTTWNTYRISVQNR